MKAEKGKGEGVLRNILTLTTGLSLAHEDSSYHD